MRRFSSLLLGGLLCVFMAFAQGCAKEEVPEPERPGDVGGVQSFKPGVPGMEAPQGMKGNKAKKPAGT